MRKASRQGPEQGASGVPLRTEHVGFRGIASGPPTPSLPPVLATRSHYFHQHQSCHYRLPWGLTSRVLGPPAQGSKGELPSGVCLLGQAQGYVPKPMQEGKKKKPTTSQ